MDSQATLLPDGQAVIIALDKKREELIMRPVTTPLEQTKVKKLNELRFTYVDRSQGQKKRAQSYLDTIYRHSAELFVLVGVSVTFTFLTNHTKTREGLTGILTWWDRVVHPQVLKTLSAALLVREALAPDQPLGTTLSPSNNAIQQDTKATSVVNTEPSKKRARTNSELATNSVDTQSLQECHRIVQLLYPRQNIESLCSLSREQLISLLDSQAPLSHASSTAVIQRSQSSASSPAESQRKPQAEPYQAAYASGEEIGIIPQTSTSTSNPHSANAGPATTNNSSIPYLNFSSALPEDSLQDNNIILPRSTIYNMRREYIFDFLKQYKGGACTVTIRYGEDFSVIDIFCDGAGEAYDVRISVTKEVADALLITLDMGAYTGSLNVPRDEVFHFFQLGPDPGATLRLVTDWTNTVLLPSMQIPKGQVIMRTSIKMDLIAYIKGMGVTLDYREEFN